MWKTWRISHIWNKLKPNLNNESLERRRFFISTNVWETSRFMKTFLLQEGRNQKDGCRFEAGKIWCLKVVTHLLFMKSINMKTWSLINSLPFRSNPWINTSAPHECQGYCMSSLRGVQAERTSAKTVMQQCGRRTCRVYGLSASRLRTKARASRLWRVVGRVDRIT